MLKVYNFGKLIAVVPKEQRDKYIYFFKNTEKIRGALEYDPEELAYSKKINLHKIISGASMENLKSWVAEGERKVMVLDDDHLIAAGYTSSHPVYSKKLWWDNTESRKSVEFVVYNTWNHLWDVTVQLPYYRASIGSDFRTETSAVNYIRTLCKENAVQMERFADVQARYKAFVETTIFIKEKGSTKDSRIKAFVEALRQECVKSPWYLANGSFSVDEIEKELYDRCRSRVNYPRLKPQACR